MCRWNYLTERIDRSAWIAAIIATVSFIVMIFVSVWLKKGMDERREQQKQKQEDIEKGIHEGVLALLPCTVLHDPWLLLGPFSGEDIEAQLRVPCVMPLHQLGCAVHHHSRVAPFDCQSS